MMKTLSQLSFVVAATLIMTAAGLHAQFLDTPRAELLALEASDTLLPPAEVVEAIENDLAAIEAAHPELAGHLVRPLWQPGAVMIGLTEEANEIYTNGGSVDEIEDLGDMLGNRTSTHHPAMSLLITLFDQPYNPVKLVESYEALESVTGATTNGLTGDGDDINLLPDHGIYVYLKAWGDCRSGCINREYRYFRVNGEVEELTAQDVARDIGFSIQTQPLDTQVHEGETATLAFELTGGNETLLKSSIVFWQRLDREHLDWANVATTPTLTLANVTNAHEGVYAAQIRHLPTGLKLLTHGALVQVDELDPVLWRRAYPMAGGWAAAWIGFFYKKQHPWIYLAGVDWFYTMGSDENAWLWNDSRGWLWTSMDFHPWIYSETDGQWSHGF